MTKILLSTKHIDDLKVVQAEIEKYVEKCDNDFYKCDDRYIKTNLKIALHADEAKDMIDTIMINLKNGITRRDLAELSEKCFICAALEGVVKSINQPDIGSKELSDTFLNLSLKIDEIIKDLKLQLVD